MQRSLGLNRLLPLAIALLASGCGVAAATATPTQPGTSPSASPSSSSSCPGGHSTSVAITSSTGPVPARWAVDPCLGAVGITIAKDGAATGTLTLSGGHWVAAPGSPPPLYSPILADDPGNHRIVLVGGTTAHWSGPGQTWAYTASGWSRLTATLAHFDQGTMAADPAHDSVVLTQADPAYACAETWVLHDNSWTRALPAAPTTPCDRIIESPLGPIGISVYPQHVWRHWTGSSWQPISGGPQTVAEATYDPATRSVVALGSSQRSIPDTGAQVTETFVLTSGGWSAGQALPQGLQGRVGPVMVAETSGDVALEDGSQSHGFIATTPASYTDLWIWNGSAWRQS